MRQYAPGEKVPLRMKCKALILSTIAAGLWFVIPAFAHHGDAGRYEDNLTILTGTVVDLQLVVPHSIIVLDVTDEDGKVVRWQAEMGARPQMVRDFGWTKDT